MPKVSNFSFILRQHETSFFRTHNYNLIQIFSKFSCPVPRLKCLNQNCAWIVCGGNVCNLNLCTHTVIWDVLDLGTALFQSAITILSPAWKIWVYDVTNSLQLNSKPGSHAWVKRKHKHGTLIRSAYEFEEGIAMWDDMEKTHTSFACIFLYYLNCRCLLSRHIHKCEHNFSCNIVVDKIWYRLTCLGTIFNAIVITATR